PASILSAEAFSFESISDRRLIATVSAAIAHPMGWPGGFPTGRPWVSLSRVLFLGSRGFLQLVTKLPEPRWTRCIVARRTLSLRNDTPLAATLTLIAFGLLCP